MNRYGRFYDGRLWFSNKPELEHPMDKFISKGKIRRQVFAAVAGGGKGRAR